ncbi:MAG: TolC family protein [Rikenellaceae bacterium]|jgi:outer membrane protein TolC|nr:TolC family protein [Rikenellaceae bacterium]
MKRSIIIVAALLTAMTATRTAHAAPTAAAEQTIEIDLPQALRIALSENPTIKIADLEIERQDYVKKETWGNLLPQLSGTAGYQNAIVKSEISKGLSFSPTHTLNFGADLTLPLIVPGVYQTLKLNNEQMRAAVESARASRIDMSNEVKKAFFNILRINQEIGVLKASRENVQQTVDQIRVSNRAGLASEYDLLTAEVQLSNLEPTILQAEKGLGIAEQYLKMLMGMPLEQQVKFTGDLMLLEQTYAAQRSLYDADLTNNSDLRSLDIQQDLLVRQLKVLRTQRMPTLGATLSGSFQGHDPINFDMAAMSGGATGWQANGTYIGQPYGMWTPNASSPMGGDWAFAAPAAASTTPVNNAFTWQHPLTLSFGLSVPIFAGFTNSNREKQLKNNIRQLSMQRDYAEKQIEVSASTSISNIYTARERMAATQKTVDQARKAYDISNVRYRAGAGTILELNSAELQLTQSQLNHSQAIYDLLSAQADYEKVIGNE